MAKNAHLYDNKHKDSDFDKDSHLMQSQFAHLADVDNSDPSCLKLKGDWVIGDSRALEGLCRSLSSLPWHIQKIDASDIATLDTAGAFFLGDLKKQLENDKTQVPVTGLSSQFDSLFALISKEEDTIVENPVAVEKRSFFYRVGKHTETVVESIADYFHFLGEFAVRAFASASQPYKIQWRSVVNEIDLAGYRALSIIAVMMFLIGVVLAYQMGVELRVYGANVYVVDVSGIAILREFSPLITSVIIAGRTSTSYAALIGTMKVNEEVDALKTMGLSPMDRLVLPKMLGLVVSLPLLVVWGDIFGVFGSMVMSKSVLGMGYMVFLQRLKQVVSVKHLYLGLVKTPVFAAIIAGIGCYQGFQAQGSAQSVGQRTTRAAVQSIFLIILADALFSILFNWMDL